MQLSTRELSVKCYNARLPIFITLALKEKGNLIVKMKNHFGTFAPGPGHGRGESGLDYLLAINQTPEILGKIDAKTDKVLYPRQQLCLVDALWASESGPWLGPSHQPNFLAMGVFSPVVDYMVATQFRGQ